MLSLSLILFNAIDTVSPQISPFENYPQPGKV